MPEGGFSKERRERKTGSGARYGMSVHLDQKIKIPPIYVIERNMKNANINNKMQRRL
jgi:hypothetical protein